MLHNVSSINVLNASEATKKVKWPNRKRTNVTNRGIHVGCLSCLHVLVHVITMGDARCDWFTCNPIKLIEVLREWWMKPLRARGFSHGFAARAVGLQPPKRSEEFSSAAWEKKPLVPRVSCIWYNMHSDWLIVEHYSPVIPTGQLWACKKKAKSHTINKLLTSLSVGQYSKVSFWDLPIKPSLSVDELLLFNQE